MSSTFKDLRFNFIRNPYSSTQTSITPKQNENKNKLIKYIEEHPKEFIEVSPVTSFRYGQQQDPTSFDRLCGIKNPYEHNNIDEFKDISNSIKEFLLATNMQLCPSLAQWVSTYAPDPNQLGIGGGTLPADVQVIDDGQTVGGDLPDNQLPDDSYNNYMIPYLDDIKYENAASSITIGMNYDPTTDKKLDYNEVCELCLSIARTYNNMNDNIKDPSVVAIEQKRRRDLIANITRYRKNRDIAAMCSDDDITKYSIEQLETLLGECVRRHNQLKLKKVSKDTLDILGKGYDVIFPLGIPIGKGRHLTFNGVGDEIIKELHNPSSAAGLAYDNIINEYNINISDKWSILAAIGSILIKNVHVTTEKKDDDDEDKAGDDDEGEDEEEDEEEEEEELAEM